MDAKVKKTLVALAGIPLMVIGLVAWILPLVPGAPLFFIGLAMILMWHPKGARLAGRYRGKLRRFIQRMKFSHVVLRGPLRSVLGMKGRR